MRIFWSYKSPEVYKLVSLAPKRGREKGKGGREKEGRRKTGRREGGKRKKQQQQQSRFQSSLPARITTEPFQFLLHPTDNISGHIWISHFCSVPAIE